MKMLVLGSVGIAGLLLTACSAQACDMTLSAVATNNGVKYLAGSQSWFGLADKDVKDIDKRGLKILDELSKQQDKGGPVQVNLTRTGDCVSSSLPTEFEGRGLTWKGAAKVLRVQANMAGELVKIAEDRGEKHPWKN